MVKSHSGTRSMEHMKTKALGREANVGKDPSQAVPNSGVYYNQELWGFMYNKGAELGNGLECNKALMAATGHNSRSDN